MAKNWAIVIGINQYNNLQHLNYAKLDALAMRDWFEKDVQFDRVFLFTEDSIAIPASPTPIFTQPTYGNLRRFLRAQFEKPLLASGDNLWFFFAGHGCRSVDRDYLMLVDSDPGDVEHTAIAVDFVTQRLRRSGADNIVLFLDACRDEGSRRGEGIGEKHQGVVTFYSCSPSQKSYEIEQLQHGSFTQALLEGLRIAGEGNCATVERLDRYLQSRVPIINQTHRKTLQNPYAIAEPATKFHLILLPDYATLTDIITIKLEAYHAEVKRDWDLAKQLWIRVNVAARGSDMQAIEAFSRIAQELGQSSAPPKSSEPTILPTVGRSVVVESAPTAQQAELQVSQFDVVKLNGSRQEVKPDSNKAQYFTEDLENGTCLKTVEIPDCTRNNTVQLEKYPLLVKRLISFAAHRLANSAEHRESQIRGEITYENWLTNQLLMETPTMQRVQELGGYEASMEKVIKDAIKDPRYIDSQLRIRECQIQLQALKRSPPILPSEEHYIKAKRQVLRYLKSDKKPKYLSNRERWHLAQLRVGKTPEEWGYLDHGYEALTEPTLTSFLLNGEPLAHITRNSYGVLCLNSPQVMFVDIDLNYEDDEVSTEATPWGRRKAVQEKEIKRAITSVANNLALTFRVYRTAKGLRLLEMSRLWDATNVESSTVLEKMGCDRLYQKLCIAQDCYRARLEIKPWRYGDTVCHFVKVIGNANNTEQAIAVQRIHDEYCLGDGQLA
ncbi:MAG: caspase family protein [Brasilonema angustatum HA4187-MV1]|jgi:uncharacterized caspase-like protein|nr:caspase family protein [Brasilonema angustatum HA4187-MV1]